MIATHSRGRTAYALETIGGRPFVTLSHAGERVAVLYLRPDRIAALAEREATEHGRQFWRDVLSAIL